MRPYGKGKEIPLVSGVLFRLFRFRSLRRFIHRLLLRYEGGTMHTLTLRRIFRHYYCIDIGLFTQGACFDPYYFRWGPPGVQVGRYCSCAAESRIFTANHPMNTMSTHAMFFNPDVGYVERDIIPRHRLEIGNDVWIGHHALILPGVKKIGDGAVIGAGAVVGKDVPPYAVMVGNPARVVRYRYSPEVIAQVQASRWWEKDPDALLQDLKTFQQPLEEDEIR